MRRFFRTAVGKTLLFILTILFGAATLASIAGIVVMVSEDMYSRTEGQVYDDLLGNMMIQDGRLVLENYMFAAGGDNLSLGNLEYELLDESLQPVSASTVSDESDENWEYTYYYRVISDGEGLEYYYDPEGKTEAVAAQYAAAAEQSKATDNAYAENGNNTDTAGTEEDNEPEPVVSEIVEDDASEAEPDNEPEPVTSETVEDDASETEPDNEPAPSVSEIIDEEILEEDSRTYTTTWYTLHCRLKPGLPENDKYAWMSTVIDLIYEFRYVVFAILLVALAAAVLCFIGLMSVTGRRPDTEDVYPGILHKVPSDVLLVADAAIAMLPLAITLEISSSQIIPYVILNAMSILFCGCVCLGMCMTIAGRIKQHTLLRSSLCWRLCSICWRGVRFCFDWIRKMWQKTGSLVRTLPFARRVAVIYGAVTLVEFCLLMAGAYLPVWFILHLIMLPLILYTAMTLQKLKSAGEALAGGDLSYHTDTQGMYGDLKEHGENLNSIASGMAIAVEERLKSERMKTELITNVSHDIKTPLTSIINYATLIGAEPCENEKITEYADVLVRQSERLKRLIEDLVEASKASSGNLEVNLSPCDAAVFLSQADGEYEEKLKNAGLTLVTRQPEQEVRIMADGRRMWRIFDNLMNNICKYAQSGTRVYVTLEVVENQAVFSFKNTSREELNVSPDELMERFVRGDKSRNTEGNGLGLSIAKSMAQLQGGTLKISTDADLFKAILSFPILRDGGNIL